MAAPTEIYVDPSIAANSGTGTIGDPYGDLQYALDQVTRNATDGDRFNIKAGTDEILSAQLSFTTYGTPTEGAPCIFQGYTSAADDGGIGGISGNGSVSVLNSTSLDYIHWIDLHLHNCGSSVIVRVDDHCYFYNCEFDNTTGDGLFVSTGCPVLFCHFHNIGGIGFQMHSSSIAYCTFENGTNDFSTAILCLVGGSGFISHNIINVDGTTDGIDLDTGATIIGNSIYSNGGTGQGITATATGETDAFVLGNIVEGFSGTGGIGFELDSDLIVYGMNAAYNNATNYDVTGGVTRNLGNNETLSASAFANASTGDFTVDTSVKATGFPTANYPGLSVRSYVDKGALQREEPAGGGGGAGPLIGGRLVR